MDRKKRGIFLHYNGSIIATAIGQQERLAPEDGQQEGNHQADHQAGDHGEVNGVVVLFDIDVPRQTAEEGDLAGQQQQDADSGDADAGDDKQFSQPLEWCHGKKMEWACKPNSVPSRRRAMAIHLRPRSPAASSDLPAPAG